MNAAPHYSRGKPDPNQLPPGLDPVTAGRFGLWLLGQWQHARAEHRHLVTHAHPSESLADRAIRLVAAWDVYEYPGKWRALAEIVGVGRWTAKSYIAGRRRMPLARRERLVAYLRADLAERLEVIRLLELPDERDEEVARGRRQGLAKAQAENRARRVARVRSQPKTSG